uniref:Uncharacterized protein n=1 Tax=Apteryx owenii TaxID=8824 RepID=A0A8B9PSI2_APTOW
MAVSLSQALSRPDQTLPASLHLPCPLPSPPSRAAHTGGRPAAVPTTGCCRARGTHTTAPALALAQDSTRVLAVGMGLAIAIPGGYYGRVLPCNSSALQERWGIKTGVLDSNYLEEVKVSKESVWDHPWQ